jgi:hypothetical protein
MTTPRKDEGTLKPLKDPAIMIASDGRLWVADGEGNPIACTRDTLRSALHRYHPELPLRNKRGSLWGIDALLLAWGVFEPDGPATRAKGGSA